MIRENVIIDVIDGLEETQKEVDLRFFFSVASLRLYEQKTGRNFFKDNEKAVRTLTEYLVNIDINNVDKLTEQEQVKLAPLLVEPAINKFVFNVLPCLYAKIQDGKYLQNEETYEECENSPWFMKLVNLEFFLKIFQELIIFQPKKK